MCFPNICYLRDLLFCCKVFLYEDFHIIDFVILDICYYVSLDVIEFKFVRLNKLKNTKAWFLMWVKSFKILRSEHFIHIHYKIHFEFDFSIMEFNFKGRGLVQQSKFSTDGQSKHANK
jgi:hypothetical protein